ncbi:hypothetical protein COW81_01010 [Candidatus Campbellbacteria bacterium CG22_combo_CG10-13_8_21_14_all_36_13]|uniref:DUF4149 domain-containing protein n=1 Tax=Candidatus Campbellbacteria bacterium CG22_combo_CG10-13_8_21_14_all_36_13 TaxID=1974529 RepID=A0A2H0DZ67_9BACT|nr:MAG: hypothetical protein COW81_01010 [Candidatus Campbellbacteria bacterium CG22_combo_CG10-13_8_21_14_all_36_13]
MSIFISLFFILAGFIIGIGAVTVIDIHGLLGRKSAYWTEATIRTHKVTKPLIWLGTLLAWVGGVFFYKNINGFSFYSGLHFILGVILVLNGLFLSFKVSPFLLKQEKEGREKELLPKSLQNKIMFSFLASFLGWWVSVLLFVQVIVLLISR